MLDPSLGALYTSLCFDTMLIVCRIGGVSKMYPTAITPKPSMIAIYILAIYIGQIGYCVLLVLARKHETKVGDIIEKTPRKAQLAL